jgi:hypothetical protein
VGDGITWDAIFCLRDILRELPKLYLDNGASPIQPDTFIDILKSNYASKKDLSLYPSRKTRIRRFQTTYKKLVDRAAHLSGKHTEKTLESMASRSSLINRYERVTGDSLIYVTEELVKNRHKLTSAELHAIISSFVEQQILCPEHFERTITSVAPPVNKKARRIVAGMMKAVETCREGI